MFVLTLADKRVVEIADSSRGQIRDYVWSPRNNFLAFSMPNDNQFTSIYVWSAGDGKLHRITDEMFNSYNPASGSAGKLSLLHQ